MALAAEQGATHAGTVRPGRTIGLPPVACPVESPITAVRSGVWNCGSQKLSNWR